MVEDKDAVDGSKFAIEVKVGGTRGDDGT